MIRQKDTYSEQIKTMDSIVAQGVDDSEDMVAKVQHLVQLRCRLTSKIEQRRKKLGVDDMEELDKLKNSKFVSCLIAARAKKQRILLKLQSRKFELFGRERPYASQSAGAECTSVYPYDLVSCSHCSQPAKKLI